MDKIIFEKNLKKNVQLLTDEHTVLYGFIEEIFENCFAFHTHGKIRYIDFNRVLEVRT